MTAPWASGRQLFAPEIPPLGTSKSLTRQDHWGGSHPQDLQSQRPAQARALPRKMLLRASWKTLLFVGHDEITPWLSRYYSGAAYSTSAVLSACRYILLY